MPHPHMYDTHIQGYKLATGDIQPSQLTQARTQFGMDAPSLADITLTKSRPHSLTHARAQFSTDTPSYGARAYPVVRDHYQP